jgi:hypothetical protein
MENANNTRPNALDLSVMNVNHTPLHYSKRLELFARWVPICQEIAEECSVELPDADRLRVMILSAHQAMCLLAQSALTFPDPITQNRIVNQFLIDCFTPRNEVPV